MEKKRYSKWFVLFLVLSFLISSCAKTPEEKVVKLGLLTAMSGGAAVYGEHIDRGARLAVDELNAEGGVAGYTLEITTEDHKVDPDVSATGVQKLLSVDGVHVVLTTFTSPTLAIQPFTSEQNVLTINAAAASPSLVNQHALFNTVPNWITAYPELVIWAIEEFDAQTVATIFWSDEAGRGTNDMVVQTCEELGCEIVAQEPAEVGETDFSTQVARVKAENPDILICAEWGDDLGYMMREARSTGLDVPVICSDFTENALEIAGEEAFVDFLVIKTPWDPDDPVDPDMATFIDAYREAYDMDPDRFAANQWESIKFVVAHLIETAVENDKDPTELGVLLEEMLRAVEEGYEFQTIIGESMTLHSDGTVAKPIWIYKYVDGKLELYATPLD